MPQYKYVRMRIDQTTHTTKSNTANHKSIAIFV
jgi:hypothetical protein